MFATGMPAPFIVEPSDGHTLTVILLHGRGSTSSEFAEDFFDTDSSAGQSLQKRFPSVKWVFPSARPRQSTVFQEEMSEWYDVYSLSDPGERLDLQKPGLVESIHDVKEIINAEGKLLEKQQKLSGQRPSIVLGGISMGCAVAIHVLLSCLVSGKGKDIGGFFGWCGWLPFVETIRSRLEGAVSNTEITNFVANCLRHVYTDDIALSQHESVQQEADGQTNLNVAAEHDFTLVPIFLSHCTDDNVVEPSLGRQLREFLDSIGMQVEWHEYPRGGHWIKEPHAMDEFTDFLQKLGIVEPDLCQ